jgi:hypothetical protein
MKIKETSKEKRKSSLVWEQLKKGLKMHEMKNIVDMSSFILPWEYWYDPRGFSPSTNYIVSFSSAWESQCLEDHIIKAGCFCTVGNWEDDLFYCLWQTHKGIFSSESWTVYEHHWLTLLMRLWVIKLALPLLQQWIQDSIIMMIFSTVEWANIYQIYLSRERLFYYNYLSKHKKRS